MAMRQQAEHVQHQRWLDAMRRGLDPMIMGKGDCGCE